MILEQVQQLLMGGQALALDELAERIPELHSRPEGREILRLLLRLDRHFSLVDGLWCLAQAPNRSEERIVQAAVAYFEAKAPRGEMLTHLVAAISQATGEDSGRVQEVVLQAFASVQGGKMVLNRRRG